MVALNSDLQVHGVLAHFWTGKHNPLPTFHRHNEIELGFYIGPQLEHTIAGRNVQIPPNTFFMFWGGFSHRIDLWEPCDIWTLAIPLTEFLSWTIPHETFVHRLLHGALFSEPDPARAPFDEDAMRRWFADLHGGEHGEQRQELVLLEVQARVRRLAASLGDHTATTITGRGAPGRVAAMLQFVAEHYREDLSIADIAAAAKTNPSHAMEVFKQSCGMSIMQYVNDQRVSHARRMLVTTDAKILDVAMESGFGSVSQFYSVFQQVCNQTPRDYARTHRGK
jgi:AraC-like DNA-binding protein